MSLNRILLVEDEVLIAMLYEDICRHFGHPVWKHVTTGEAALEVAIREMPDLVLMDIQLAGTLDGIATAEKIMALNQVPIVFISGFSNQEIRSRAELLKPLAYLEKPISFDRLQQIFESLREKG